MSEADKARLRMAGKPKPPDPHYKYQNSRSAEKSTRKNMSRLGNWLRNGQMPSLWTMARIQFLMGITNVIMTLLSAVAGILAIWFVVANTGSSSFSTLELNIGSFVWIGIAGLVFPTATAVFMIGAAITSYLARLDDRQTSKDTADVHDDNSEQPPATDGSPAPNNSED